LFPRARSAHGVRLPRPRLPICKNRHIIALQERADAIRNVVPDTPLGDFLAEYTIKDEELSALWRIDTQARRRGDLNHGSLKTLRDIVEPRIARAERWTHANHFEAVRRRCTRYLHTQRRNLPTLTDVRPSSSDIRLPFSYLPLMLGRLLFVDGRYIMLCGRGRFTASGEDCAIIVLWGRDLAPPSGEPGGEDIISRRLAPI